MWAPWKANQKKNEGVFTIGAIRAGHLSVKLSGVVLNPAEIRWRINIRCGMRHRSQRKPLWEVCCKMGQRWQVRHTLLSSTVLDKLEMDSHPPPPFTIWSFRGTIWHLLHKKTNSVTHWNASKHLAIPIRHARLTSWAEREQNILSHTLEQSIYLSSYWTYVLTAVGAEKALDLSHYSLNRVLDWSSWAPPVCGYVSDNSKTIGVKLGSYLHGCQDDLQ